jgi:hypothetical protein
MSPDELLASYRAKIESGATSNEIVQMLHDEGVSLVHSVKCLTDLYSIRMAEAKQIVADHPCWKTTHEGHSHFHDALKKEFEDG